ncbi:MAG: hypothetical protein GY832_25120 [Chloroflexi bacterium]|nr:hypothetical protein [Chloroflexota bacterium]
MMSDNNIFVFGNESDIVRADDLVVRIPASISDFSVLFAAYYDQLELPGYVGQNWNALSECLRDLSWVEQRRVIIVHEESPQLSAADTTEYVDVLRECAADWKPDEEHELIVLFPRHCRDDVLGHMRNPS